MGAAHERSGQPCEDAIDWTGGPDLPIAMAVADGHGSSQCFRAAEGARLAVEAALRELPLFFGARSEMIKESPETVAADWAHRMVRVWQSRVGSHLERNKLDAEELEMFPFLDHAPPDGVWPLAAYLVYGATSLNIYLTDEFVVYSHLGDGDLLLVDDNGNVSRPLPAEPGNIGNETTSLCSPQAYEHMRVSITDLSSHAPPALVLASTDGYANSFASDNDFRKAATDIYDMIRTEGFDVVRQELPAWLAETTQEGSGDDISVGIIARMPA